MRRVLLVPNLRYESATGAARELATWLSAQGFEPVVSADDADGSGLADIAVAPNALGEPVLVVALGGDGTILKAVHLLGEVQAPILGVNLGHLGFLSGASAAQMREAVSAALAGECRFERRGTLHAHIMMGGREVGSYRALNEVALMRGGSGRVVRLELAISGTAISTMDCDGLIVATATGSTAYALSAGGPIISPEVACALVVPVAPHSLARASVVTGPSDVIEVTLPDPARRDACLSVDGDVMPCRRAIESLRVTRGEHDVLLVRPDGRDFYDVVRSEFYGGK